MTTPLSAIIWVSVGSFIGSLGAVGLKAGAKNIELDVRALLTNWKLVLGVGGYLISSVFYMIGIKKGEISVLFPMVSTGYIWTMLWSKLVFGESFTRAKFIGLTLILAGCIVLGLGKR